MDPLLLLRGENHMPPCHPAWRSSGTPAPDSQLVQVQYIHILNGRTFLAYNMDQCLCEARNLLKELWLLSGGPVEIDKHLHEYRCPGPPKCIEIGRIQCFPTSRIALLSRSNHILTCTNPTRYLDGISKPLWLYELWS